MKLQLDKESFLKFFNINDIDIKEKSFLCAVSGGVDSMVLYDLMIKCNLNLSVASCNYKSRKESDNEIEMIKSICAENKINFHSEIFRIDKQSTGKSFQMLAREKRYEWFKSLMNEFSYDYLVTAHHADDNIETILLNFSRTTGFKGLLGIPESKNQILRPMLSFEKDIIINYAKKNKIKWSEDSSNKTNLYNRNKIRKNILPILKEINPSFIHSISTSVNRLRLTENFINDKLDKFKEKYVTIEDNFVIIDKSFIVHLREDLILFYELLGEYGFSFSQIEKHIPSIKKINKKLISKTHQLIGDRKNLIIAPLDYEFNTKITSKSIREVNCGHFKIRGNIFNKGEISINKNKKNAQLDYDKIQFPITYRNYSEGDSFSPLGMRNQKKVSSYISDIKLNYIDKIHQLVLEDNKNNIVWLVGQQISDKYKVDNYTKKILNLEII